jgi:uncharacterized protein (TIGR02722 family)
MKKSLKIILFLTTLFIISCASGPARTVKRTSADSTIDLSGRWNDTDSRLVAKQMISDVLSRAWLTDFMQASGKKPVVIVGTIRNKTSEHIETETFIRDLQRELINSGKVKFVANRSERSEIRMEKEDQQSNATEDTAKRLAAEKGADFMLKGVMSSITDAVEGRKIVFYQVDLELINIESNETVWIGTKKIKKDIAQSGSTW